MPLRLHRAEPGPLPLAVVLGLLLRGDRLAALRPGARPRPSSRACSPPSARTASSATRSSGTGRSRWSGSPFYNVASRRALQTETIQPPLLAWAWRIAVGDPARGAADRRPGRLARRQPRPRGRRPALDRPAGRVRPRRLAEVRTGLGTARERPRSASRCWSARNRRLGFDARRDPRRAAARCSARSLVNTLWSLSLQALGRPSATPALVERLWDERRGLFVDEAQPGGAAPRAGHLGRAGAAGAARPAGGDRPAPGRGAPAEPEPSSSPPVAPPSVAAAEPSYEPGGGRGPIRRYWRGPTWVNSAWMVWLGLRRLGYERGGRRAGRRRDRRGRPRRPARVLRPARRAPASAPRTSPGRRSIAELADPNS